MAIAPLESVIVSPEWPKFGRRRGGRIELPGASAISTEGFSAFDQAGARTPGQTRIANPLESARKCR